jgi:hypothetical protein
LSDFIDKFADEPLPGLTSTKATRKRKGKPQPRTQLSPSGRSEAPREIVPATAKKDPLTYRATTPVDQGLKNPPVRLKTPSDKRLKLGPVRLGIPAPEAPEAPKAWKCGDHLLLYENVPKDKEKSAIIADVIRRKAIIIADVIRRKAIIKEKTHGNTWILAIAMMETETLREDDPNYPVGDAYPPAVKYQYSQPGLQVPVVAPPFLSNLRMERPVISGDLFPTPKTGEAANYGIYKMNWYMIQRTKTGAELLKTARAEHPSLTDDALSKAAGSYLDNVKELEGLQKATQVIIEAWEKWGHDAPDGNNLKKSAFWAGHRWGGSGLLDKTYSHFQDVLAYYKGVERIKRCCDADRDVWTNSVRYYAAVSAV